MYSALNINYNAILPEIIIGITLFLSAMADAFSSNRKWFVGLITLLGFGAGIGSSIYLWDNKFISFYQMIVLDNFSLLLFITVMIAGFITVLVSIKYVDTVDPDGGHYYLLLLSSILGMMFLVSATNLIVMVLGLELMSLSVYPLVGFTRDRQISLEGAMKYLVLGAFATAFLLYGIALVYSVLGTTNFYTIAKVLVTSGNMTDNLVMMAGVALILIGFSFKVALVPFHAWTPDAYQGAPAPITGFMAAAVKAASFAAIIKLIVVVLYTYHIPVAEAMWWLSAITMFMGNVIAVMQKDVKRMLAYSSIAHAGYIVVGLVAETPYGMSSAIFYLISYTFTITGSFAVISYLEKNDGTGSELSDFSGLYKTHPVLSFVMTVFMLSLAGIPPTAGFMAKFYVFSSAIKTGYIGLAIFGILTSVISLYYYLRVVYAMYFEEPEREINLPVSAGISAGIIIALLGVVQLGIMPSDIMSLAVQSIQSLIH
ncbi:MAG: NADH-quinone oxidoreductase subunit N [bacterium]